MTWSASPGILEILAAKGSDWTKEQEAAVVGWLTETQYRRLLGWCVFCLPPGQRDQAEDALQDFFLQMSKQIGQYDPGLGAFSSYLLKRLQGFLLNWKRARSRRPGLELIDNREQKPDVGDPFLRREIEDCIRRQPARARKALMLLAAGYERADIAQELGVSNIHAGVIIHKARHMLEDCLKAKDINVRKEGRSNDKSRVG